MSEFGRVINGGAQMRKGLTKGINDKLQGFAKEQDRRKMLSDSVKKALYTPQLSAPHLNNVNGSKFTTPKKVTNV